MSDDIEGLVIMEYTQLGRTGLSVSRLVLGTGNFGPEAQEDVCHAIMDRALENGINFIDTADIYGVKLDFTGNPGHTEEIIGRWFATGGGRREKIVLSSKLFYPMGTWPNEGGMSALHIRRACDASLKRLQTDYIDLYQAHRIDRDTPWDEVWEAYSVLHQQGKVLYFGSSNYAGWHIAAAQEAAKARHMLGLVSEQPMYNLLARWPELEILPAAEHYGMGVFAFSPLYGGLLGGVLRKQREGTASRSNSPFSTAVLARYRDSIESYETLCDDLGEHPAHVGLAWLLAQKVVTAPIIGPRTVEQFDNALGALEVTLDADTLTTLDKIFPPPGPNPGNPAPEAFLG